MKKNYDRTEALEMMYDLKEEGYINIILCFVGTGNQDRPLYLGCDGSAKTNKFYPKFPLITVDSVEMWGEHPNERFYKGRPKREYWWIFD